MELWYGIDPALASNAARREPTLNRAGVLEAEVGQRQLALHHRVVRERDVAHHWVDDRAAVFMGQVVGHDDAATQPEPRDLGGDGDGLERLRAQRLHVQVRLQADRL